MPSRRLRHLGTTFLVVLSLLFSQLALARYVCPQQGGTQAMAGLPCDGMDLEQPLLCHQHAADASQTFEALKLPVASLPLRVQMLELPLPLDAEAGVGLPPCAAAEAQAPPDPLFLATLRLRV